MSTVKISQLPTLVNLDANTANSLFIGLDKSSGVTGQFTARTLARGLYSNEILNVGNNQTFLPNTVAQFYAAGNSYIQTNLVNSNDGGTADMVITANTGTDTTYFVDFGFANKDFVPGTEYNSLGTAIYPLDAYMYVQGREGQLGGNLTIATTTSNTEIKFVAGGYNSANIVAKIKHGGLYLVNDHALTFSDGSVQESSAIFAESFANGAFVHANSAHGLANSGATFANGAFASANSGATFANAAFSRANSGYGVANTGSSFANGAFVMSNSAYAAANSGATFANASFLRANASYIAQNTTADFANGAFVTANSSYLAQNTTADFANGAFVTANASYNSQNTTAAFANGAFVMSNSAHGVANTGSSFANGAFVVANSSAIFANAAFDRANSGYGVANTGSSFANGAFVSANSGAVFANAAFTRANSAYAKANSALANTSGTFDGSLSITGDLSLLNGSVSAAGNMRVNGTIVMANSNFSATEAALTIKATANVATPSNDGYMLHISGKQNTASRIVFDSYSVTGNAYAVIAGRTARGTVDAPLPVANGDVLMRVSGNGRGNTSWTQFGVARMDIVATENYTDERRGSQIQFWNCPAGSNTLQEIATFNGESVVFTGVVNPQKGFRYTPNVLSGIVTTLNIDIANNSLYYFKTNATTTINLSGYQPGKIVEVWITNTDTGGGSNHTITHGCLANNSTIGATSFTLTSLHSAYIKYFSIDGDQANTFCQVTYS